MRRKRLITVNTIPSPARLRRLRRKARRERTFVRVLLSAERDFVHAMPTSVYDVRGSVDLINRADVIAVRLPNGSRAILKSRPHPSWVLP